MLNQSNCILEYSLIPTERRLTFDILYQDEKTIYRGDDDGPYHRFVASNGYEVISRSRMDIQTERLWLLGAKCDEEKRSGTMIFSSNEKRDKAFFEFTVAINEWAQKYNGFAINYYQPPTPMDREVVNEHEEKDRIIIPIVTEESKHRFVPSDIVPHREVELYSTKFITGLLIPNETIGLLALSESIDLLSAGYTDVTDSISEIGGYIKTLAIKIKNPDLPENSHVILKPSKEAAPLHPSTDGSWRLLKGNYIAGLNGQTVHVIVSANTELGTVRMDKGDRMFEDYEILGYELHLNRTNQRYSKA